MKLVDESSETERAWEAFKHIDSIREGRANFFLVAESMMIAAFMALPASESFLQYIVSILGLIFSVAWFLVNLRQSKRLDYLAHNHLSKEPMFILVMKAGTGIPGRFIMNLLPLLTALFWIVLIAKVN